MKHRLLCRFCTHAVPLWIGVRPSYWCQYRLTFCKGKCKDYKFTLKQKDVV